QQEIKAEPLFIENYGWAISVNYLPYSKAFVSIEFMEEAGEWKVYSDKRDGRYDFCHIHGRHTFNGTDRNLKPGNYNVRLRYFNNLGSGEWHYASVTIPEYDKK